ncbi:uncharacterized protein LOC113759197, partial [Coffea eugenioides]|uniref:uncharacterized protein LOC113759197 n=1 Tax=Coffea eugenioides TaxID=49369 RepID=UPI000F605554
MASEMAAQNKLIDELISSGVQPEPPPVKQPESEPFVIPPIQTTFEGVFNPQYTYTQNLPFYPLYGQGFQPQGGQGGPNMPPGPQAFYQPTAEPVVPEHTVQTKPELPVGFKTPKFNKYDGTGYPKTHLRLFANKLGKPVDDENLPLRLFPESLEGDALDWYSNLKPDEVKTWLDLSNAFIRQYEYNCELAPTRTTLEGTKRRPSEDHKTYAKRWRKIAAKVEPPMTEDEIIRTFIKAHDPPYFEEIFRRTGCTFAAIVNKLEEYDDFVRAGKIVNVSALKSQVEALQGQGSSGKKPQFKKKEGETTFIWNQNPSPKPRYQPNPTYQPHYPYNSNPHHLKAAGKIGTVPPPAYPYGIYAGYNPQAVCAYHSGAPEHSTVDCKAFKHRIQDMIEAGEIVIRKKEAQGPNINRNPLPEHANTIGVILDNAEYEQQVQKLARKAELFGVTDQPFVIEVPFEEDKRPFILDLTLAESKALEPVVIEFPEQEPVLSLQRVPWNYDEPVIQIGEKSVAKEEVSVVTRSGGIASPFGAIVPIQTNNPDLPAKPAITEKEALDFLKRLQRSEYNVVEKLSKSPAQISMLDLLFSSDMHRDALLEVLTKAQIPKDISVANFSHIVGSVLFTKQITFSDDELPAEGIGHNKALYIAVRCNGKILPKVLIDNGSALNICPWINDKLITIFAEEDCLVIADSGAKEDGSRSATVTPHSTADIIS